ncbi:MAG: hypothetical protein EOM53_00030 [Alphaproteobacteria bacterium]|nr:hypothetical protein [Alphaproteobacteria bacterium]NCB49060.1 hypothetical protein [Alphaproteobacteria bacterium]
MKHFDAISSEIYLVEIEDILRLEKSNATEKGEIIVLIGDSKKGTKDCLISGKKRLQEALLKNKKQVPVCFAFEKRAPFLISLIRHFVKPLRRKIISFSSNSYHINPFEIRQKKMERVYRTKENAYAIHNRHCEIPKEKRVALYEELEQSIRDKGFDDAYPLEIMLCRKFGWKDNLFQGHHRMSILMDEKVERISVRFCAAGYMPLWLARFFRTRNLKKEL